MNAPEAWPEGNQGGGDALSAARAVLLRRVVLLECRWRDRRQRCGGEDGGSVRGEGVGGVDATIARAAAAASVARTATATASKPLAGAR